MRVCHPPPLLSRRTDERTALYVLLSYPTERKKSLTDQFHRGGNSIRVDIFSTERKIERFDSNSVQFTKKSASVRNPFLFQYEFKEE